MADQPEGNGESLELSPPVTKGNHLPLALKQHNAVLPNVKSEGWGQSTLLSEPLDESEDGSDSLDRLTLDLEWVSLQYPREWTFEQLSSTYGILTNFETILGGGLAPIEAIKTDVTLLPESFETLVNPEQPATLGEEETTVLKREELQINGRQAVRLWLATPAFDFSHAIVTYIRYSNEQTLFIASYYSAENPVAENLIQQVHQSLVCPMESKI